MTTLELIVKARQVIERLPQRQHIRLENIERWLSVMSEREPERLLWHATRLSGIGGSEIGKLVANRRNLVSNFGSARRLVMEKLLIVLPDAPNAYMARGIETEDMHRVKFLVDWNARQDTEAITVLSNARGPLPYMRYSPDDAVRLPDNSRVLVDYKSPSKADDPDQFDFNYNCQINMGDVIAKQVGLHFDRGLLSRLNWAEWVCTCNWVELDPVLQEEITDTAHFYWTQCVLKGDLPPLPSPPEAKFETAAEVIRHLHTTSAQIVAIDETMRALKARGDVLKAEFAVVAATGDPGAKATIYAHDFTVGEQLVEDRLRDVLITKGLDVDVEMAALMEPVAYDVPAILSALQAGGGETDGFVTSRKINIEAVRLRIAELEVAPNLVFDYPVGVKKKGSLKKHPAPLALQQQYVAHGNKVCAEVCAAVTEAVAPRVQDDTLAADLELIEESGDAMVMG